MNTDRIITLADCTDPSDPAGRSYRQINAAKTHSIPLGALVELSSGERLYVVLLGRDCDQEPLYWLSLEDWGAEENSTIKALSRFGGYPEQSLSIVRMPEQRYGAK